MVVGFTTKYAIRVYHNESCEFEPRSWEDILDITVNVIIIFQMLFFSARDDNIERIELALKNGADVNWPLDSYLTTENVRTIRIDIFIYISLLYLIC
jgi:hypothetical protein